LFTFVGASRGHLCDSIAFLYFILVVGIGGNYERAYTLYKNNIINGTAAAAISHRYELGGRANDPESRGSISYNSILYLTATMPRRVTFGAKQYITRHPSLSTR